MIDQQINGFETASERQEQPAESDFPPPPAPESLDQIASDDIAAARSSEVIANQNGEPAPPPPLNSADVNNKPSAGIELETSKESYA